LPARFIAASQLPRAFFQPSPDSGTAQLPLPLQEFSPLIPWPAQSF
jgi:hypothetical protein